MTSLSIAAALFGCCRKAAKKRYMPLKKAPCKGSRACFGTQSKLGKLCIGGERRGDSLSWKLRLWSCDHSIGAKPPGKSHNLFDGMLLWMDEILHRFKPWDTITLAKLLGGAKWISQPWSQCTNPNEPRFTRITSGALFSQVNSSWNPRNRHFWRSLLPEPLFGCIHLERCDLGQFG